MYPITKLTALFRRYIIISLRAESEFRADFLTSVIQLVLNSVLVIVFWDAIFRITGPVNGWTFADSVMMAGVGELSWVVAMLFPGMDVLPDRIIKGDFDRYLTKPAPVLLSFAWERLSIPRVFHSLVAGLCVLGLAVFQFDFQATGMGIALGLVLMTLGRVSLVLLNTSVSLVGFWAGKMQTVQSVLGEFSRFARYPVVFFGSPMRLLLTWVWPYGLYLTYPVLLARGELELSRNLLTGAGLLLAGWWLVVLLLFRAGLRRYESFEG